MKKLTTVFIAILFALSMTGLCFAQARTGTREEDGREREEGREEGEEEEGKNKKEKKMDEKEITCFNLIFVKIMQKGF